MNNLKPLLLCPRVSKMINFCLLIIHRFSGRHAAANAGFFPSILQMKVAVEIQMCLQLSLITNSCFYLSSQHHQLVWTQK